MLIRPLAPIPRLVAPLLLATLVTTFFAIAAPTTHAQFIDNPDLPISARGRTVALDYSDDGYLVVAYVEPDPSQDKLVLVARDPAQTWSTLFAGTLGRMHRIVHLDLDTAHYPGTIGERRVFIGVSAAWRPNDPYSFTGLLSGRYDQAWSQAKCREWDGGSFTYTRFWQSGRTSVAVIPDYATGDYFVGVAVAHRYIHSDDVVLMFYSRDHGDSVETASVIAGPFGEAIDASRGSFGHPSLAYNEPSRSTVLAFHDADSGQVHITEAPIAAHVDRRAPLQIVHSTGSSRDKRHHPNIAIHSRGELNLTALAGNPDPMDGSYGLTFYHAPLAGTLTEFRSPSNGPYLHARAVTAGDVVVRRSDAYITALCVTDPMPTRPGVAVFAFRTDRNSAGELVSETVNDTPVLSGPDAAAPRLTPTPGGFFDTAVIAFVESGARAGLVSIDAEP